MMADTSEPVAPEISAVPPPPAIFGRASALPLVAGGVLAAAIGFGAARILPGDWVANTALQTQFDTQSAELSALKASVTQLELAPQTDNALTDRVAALESEIAANQTPDVAPLFIRLDALDQAVVALQSRAATSVTDPAALAALQAQIDALKSGGIAESVVADARTAIDTKLAEAEAKFAALKIEVEAMAAIAAKSAALRQLLAALDSGAPFAATLLDMSLPAVLADNAAAGLPTQQSLRNTFPDAARNALDAALKANMGESWTERVTAFLRDQTGARSLTPRDGSHPDAVLSRAEAALAKGDLATALSEIATLPPESQAAMVDWLTDANLRQEAALAVQSLVTASGQ